jgi:hypothetical protein
MRKLTHSISLWQSLLAISIFIILYLVSLNIREALSYSSIASCFNQQHAHISWAPSDGPVDHYLLEVTDTQFLSDSTSKSVLTRVKYLHTRFPYYTLQCEHNHSYKVRIKAVSPSGYSSDYSEESILFICDRKNPEITPTPLPSPRKVRYPAFTITGGFYEPHLSFITVNGTPASINPVDMSFNARVELKVGTNSLNILARDLAGNTTKKSVSLNYAPLTIFSLPAGAGLYWNGNYAYSGIYSGTTPRSYNQVLGGKQVLRLSYPGFNDYYGIIDFSDLSQDTYTIPLVPSREIELNEITSLKSQGKEIVLSTHSHPFVVDYNLDGKKDLLLGSKEGKIALFINSGTESAPVFSDYHFLKTEEGDIDVGTHAAPFMVDYNNDGNQDLLVGNGEGLLCYYANQGSSSEPAFISSTTLKDTDGLTIGVDSYCTPCVVDWDEDHRKDILLGSGSGTLVVYLNQGEDSNPLFASPLSVEIGGDELTVGSFAAPFVADWNSDGKKDLLVGDGDGYVHLYYNDTDGNAEFLKTEKVYLNSQELTVEGAAVPSLIDWNQDGRKELLLGSSDGRVYLAM